MAGKGISMRKTKEILRLKFVNQLSFRQIARACQLSKTTAKEYVERAEKVGLTIEKIQTLSEDEIEKLLFPESGATPSSRPLPDWEEVHLELKKKGVTLQGLWEEYREQHPDGLSYSRFHELYQKYSNTVDAVMRQTHRGGEKLFVDYSGKTIEIVDSTTGEIQQAEIFVAVWGASNYTFAEATWTQSLPDWIGSHIRAMNFFGGVPALIIPDNLKSGIKKPWYYDPDINPTYQEFASYYQTAILPARVKKPRDKGKVENGVLVIQRWILMKLRKRRFFSLDEANQAIRELLEKANARPFKKLPGSRQSTFEEIDKPALLPLPAQPYEYAEWKKARVNIDYHVEFKDHYYSVPYQLIGQLLDLRATSKILEIFHRGKRITSHQRSYHKGKPTTLDEHMPKNHQFMKWNPQRFLSWAKKWGDNVEKVIAAILESPKHPEIGFRACLGVFRLGQKVGPARLDAACQRALHCHSPKYRTVRTILENGQDSRPLPMQEENTTPSHENLRGSAYFQAAAKGEEYANSTNNGNLTETETDRDDKSTPGAGKQCILPGIEL